MSIKKNFTNCLIKQMRIRIVHPDLGIGGAERLIVDTASALIERGHEISIYTSHHDSEHCFPETKSRKI